MAKLRRGIHKVKGSPNYYRRVRLPDGGMVPRTFGTSNYKEALRQFELERGEGRVALSSKAPRFEAFGETYLDSLRSDLRRERTIESAKGCLKHLSRAFGAKRLNAIALSDIERFKAMRAEDGASRGTLNRDLTILKALLRKARALRLIPEVPEIKKVRLGKKVPEEAMTAEDVERLLVSANCERDRLALRLDAMTGLRRSELFWLQWQDLRERPDKTGTVRVRGKTDGAIHWIPKSHDERSFRIPHGLLRALRTYQKRQDPKSEWMFPGEDGKRFKSPAKMVREIFQRAGLHRHGQGLHALRRFFASTLVAQGADLKSVSRLLGHGSIAVTELYIYGSSSREDEILEGSALWAIGTKNVEVTSKVVHLPLKKPGK